MNIDEAIAKMLSLPQRVADEGVAIMKEEAPRRTGELRESIISEVTGEQIFIGTDKEYAYYVQNGRGEVTPKRRIWLHWEDPYGEVFTKRAGPAKPNDFVGRTAKRLARMKFL